MKLTIQVDGMFYAGEHVDKFYDINKGTLTSGFHPNTNKQVSKLKWSDDKADAYEAWGARDVNSVLQKIEQRMRLGKIDKDAKIEITNL